MIIFFLLQAFECFCELVGDLGMCDWLRYLRQGRGKTVEAYCCLMVDQMRSDRIE